MALSTLKITKNIPGTAVRGRIKNFIMHTLGAPVIKVELTEPQLDSAIDMAVDLFAQRSPYAEKVVIMQTNSGQVKYDLPDDIIDVREVIYNPHLNDFFLNEFFNEFFIDDFVRLTNMTDYYIQTMYNEMYIRVTGREGTWEVIDNQLYLFPTPQKAQPVMIFCGRPLEEGDVRRLDWVRDYALAHAKEILGRIRSKYATLPGPRTSLTLDGDALIKEGREDKKELMIRINEFQEPLPMITG